MSETLPVEETVSEAEALSRPGQDLALQSLLRGESAVEAARLAGVNERTVRRWLQEPEFLRALLEARGAVMQQARGRAQNALAGSVDTALGILGDAEAAGSARVRALRAVFDIARSGENGDLELRLVEMEQRLERATTALRGVLEEVDEGNRGRLFDAE